MNFQDINKSDDLLKISFDKLPDCSLPNFLRNEIYHPHLTTIVCADNVIKGGKLIQTVHAVILDKFQQHQHHITNLQTVEKIAIASPKDWFKWLGTWKVDQIKNYPPKQKTEIKTAEVYGEVFNLGNNRIHIDIDFKIDDFAVTKILDKRSSKKYRGDLSYEQVCTTIDYLKETYSLEDKEIANMQLKMLTNGTIDELNEMPLAVDKFIHFLNALMFGVETCGMDAGLAIGLMTLELIVEEKFDYKSAFCKNDDGGHYPYATLSGESSNSGTFFQRWKYQGVLEDTYGIEKKLRCEGMEDLRENPELSPIALKEVFQIKYWLDVKGHLASSNTETLENQLTKINYAVDQLVQKYFCGV